MSIPGIQTKEVFHISDDHNKISLDKSQLLPFNIPLVKNNRYNWNIALGHKQYIPKKFKPDESTIFPLIKGLEIKGWELDELKYDIIAPSAFFQYIITEKTSEFYVIFRDGKYVIANCDRRLGQDTKMSFVGIRFEDLLIHGARHKTLDNRNAFYSVRETTVGKLKCLYFSEIDSYDDSTNNDKKSSYTEIKMVLCRHAVPRSTHTKTQKLEMYGLGNNYYSQFLFRLIVQCHFSGIDNLIIGTRDRNFNVTDIEKFSISDDIVPYFKREYPEAYDELGKGLQKIKRALQEIQKTVTHSQPVSILTVGHTYRLQAVHETSQQQAIILSVLTNAY